MVNSKNESLRQKAENLKGYVTPFELKDDIVTKILNENQEIVY